MTKGLGYNHNGKSYEFPVKKEYKNHPQVKEAVGRNKKAKSEALQRKKGRGPEDINWSKQSKHAQKFHEEQKKKYGI